MPRFTTPTSEITFAGIDYHKRFSMIALGDSEGKLVEHHKLINDERIIRDFFKQYPGVSCAVESCRGYEWFVDLLQDIGLNIKVSDPRRVKLIAESSGKTDKADSKFLMELLARNYLPLSYVPTPEERRVRERLRWRLHLMRTSTRIKLRIHALLDKENKGNNSGKLFSAGGRRFLEQVQVSAPRRELIQKHLAVLDFLDEQLDTEYKWIKDQVKENADAQLLKTVPGIGDLSALTLIAELGDIQRFKRAEQVACYLGLVPREDSSGGRRRLGGITKQGNSLVRWLLVQDAWQAIRCDHDLRQLFHRISFRRGRNVAIVAVARKLSEIAYNVLRHKTPYDPQRLATGPARRLH